MDTFSLKNLSLWFLLVLVVFSVSLFSAEFFTKAEARIIFLDVGQGDATLIQTQNGRNILIDAGRDNSISEKISSYVKNNRSIDLALATHPDIDHISGFGILLDEYEIKNFYHGGLNAGAPIYRKIVEKINSKKIPHKKISSGEKYFLDKNFSMEILYPHEYSEIENPNDHSVIIILDYLGQKILLPGDTSREVEKKLVDVYGYYLDVDVLKLGHHGSKTSSSDSFLKIVDPEYGIISASCNNSFGHPHASVLKVLDENNVEDLETCDYGDIIFSFEDGKWNLENKKS